MIDNWGKGAKYWDHAWNPILGCEKISEGCQNCYAARLADQYPELRDENGGFSPHLPKCLKKVPKSGVVFVGNMTDIFGGWNADEKIGLWLNSLSQNAVNLVLTKRAEWLSNHTVYILDNVWYGITAENQKRYDERIQPFGNCFCGTSRRTWLSLEPLLGPIDDMNVLISNEDFFGSVLDYIGWVVVGAESGPAKVRRPCKLEWVESIVQQCRSAGVPVFVKQLDINGKLVKDIEKFPEHLQIRQVPWGEKE